MFDSTRLRVVFVAPHRLISNNGLHIYSLAREWHSRGVQTVVLAHGDVDADAAELGGAFGQMLNVGAVDRITPTPTSITTIIHAWTPREHVRKLTQQICLRHGWRYVVHLEDNEAEILKRHCAGVGVSFPPAPDWFATAAGASFTDPQQMREFLEKSAGVSVITERLREFVPKGIPVAETWAGFDATRAWEDESSPEFRRWLGVREHDQLITFAGSIISANQRDFQTLVDAVTRVRSQGVPVRLVQTGRTQFLFPGVIHLGFRSRDEVALALRTADVLVQPGGADEFNDYRFPSKIPEYLASGRPTVLPSTNIGGALRDGVNCVLLRDGGVEALASAITKVLMLPDKGAAIGHEGREFATTHLTWSACADRLQPLYAVAMK